MDSAIDIMATVRRAGGTDGSPPNRARSRSCSSNGRRAIGLCRPGRGTARWHLTVRPTQDLDFLTRPSAGDVRRVGEEFVAASHARSWSVEQVRDTGRSAGCSRTAPEDLLAAIALMLGR